MQKVDEAAQRSWLGTARLSRIFGRKSPSRLGAGLPVFAVLEAILAFARRCSRDAKLSSILDFRAHTVCGCLESVLAESCLGSRSWRGFQFSSKPSKPVGICQAELGARSSKDTICTQRPIRHRFREACSSRSQLQHSTRGRRCLQVDDVDGIKELVGISRRINVHRPRPLSRGLGS